MVEGDKRHGPESLSVHCRRQRPRSWQLGQPCQALAEHDRLLAPIQIDQRHAQAFVRLLPKTLAQGHAEEVVGRAIAGRRHEVVIADKVAPDHLRPDDIRAAFEGSCRRLGTDYIDVYFIHWPNIDLPIDDAMSTLERMREAGHIRALGVSNFTPGEMAEAGLHSAMPTGPPRSSSTRTTPGPAAGGSSTSPR